MTITDRERQDAYEQERSEIALAVAILFTVFVIGAAIGAAVGAVVL